jgi:hypothetical protein
MYSWMSKFRAIEFLSKLVSGGFYTFSSLFQLVVQQASD